MSHRVPQRRASNGRVAIKAAPDVHPSANELLAHDLRNGLAGVRGAVQIVRDRISSAAERDVLSAAMARLDRIDQKLREWLLEEVKDERQNSRLRRIAPRRAAKDAS